MKNLSVPICAKVGFIIVFCFIYFPIFGQDTLRSLFQVSLQTGFDKHMVSDDMISPLVYQGSHIPIRLEMQRLSKQSIHSFSVYYNYLNLHSSITTDSPSPAFYTLNHNAFICYSYCRRVVHFNKRQLALFAGFELKELLNYRDHYYSDKKHFTTGELVTTGGISFVITKQFKQLKQSLLQFRCNIPLVAYDLFNYSYNAQVAKDFNSDAEDNTATDLMKFTHPVGPNKYFEFQTNLVYSQMVSAHIGFVISHNFRYYRAEKYDNLLYTNYLNNQFLLGLICKF